MYSATPACSRAPLHRIRRILAPTPLPSPQLCIASHRHPNSPQPCMQHRSIIATTMAGAVPRLSPCMATPRQGQQHARGVAGGFVVVHWADQPVPAAAPCAHRTSASVSSIRSLPHDTPLTLLVCHPHPSVRHTHAEPAAGTGADPEAACSSPGWPDGNPVCCQPCPGCGLCPSTRGQHRCG